jgi:hypothetical protein
VERGKFTRGAGETAIESSFTAAINQYRRPPRTIYVMHEKDIGSGLKRSWR